MNAVVDVGVVGVTCLHSERESGLPAEMVYSAVVSDWVCPVCGARSVVLDDEHRLVAVVSVAQVRVTAWIVRLESDT